jgi:hypothetical protein
MRLMLLLHNSQGNEEGLRIDPKVAIDVRVETDLRVGIETGKIETRVSLVKSPPTMRP